MSEKEKALLIIMMEDVRKVYIYLSKKYNLEMQLTIISSVLELIAKSNHIEVVELVEYLNKATKNVNKKERRRKD